MSLTSKRKPWGIIADDLTGATDVGAAFAAEGFSAQVVLDSKLIPGLNSDVVLLTTYSRYHPPVIAGLLVIEAVQLLASHSIDLVYKKIDSTLKGNLVSEIRTVTKLTKRPIVLCPANPTQGRTLMNGQLDVRGKVLNLVETLKLQGCNDSVVLGQPIDDFPFDRAGTKNLNLDSLANTAGCDASAPKSDDWTASTLCIADAQSDAHLDAIVEAAERSHHDPMLVGSAGLAAALARKLRRLQSEKEDTSPELADANRPSKRRFKSDRPTLLLIGSSNPVTLEQIELLVARGQAVEFTFGLVQDDGIKSSFRAGQSVVIKIPMEDRNTESIVDDMESIVRIIEDGLAGSLLLSGGDTAQLFLDQLCPQAIDVMGEILPGLAVGKLVGGRADGITLVTKPGGFGTESSLSDAVALL